MQVRTWVYEIKVDWKNIQGPYTSRVPIACMKALLEYEAMADPDTRRRFEGWARGEYRDIRFEVDLAIARKMGRDFSLSRYGRPNLDRFFKEAKKHSDAGSYHKAIQIYKGVTEAIGVHMDLIPDKGGDCSIYLEEALSMMAECVQAAKMDDTERRKEIRYLAEWSMRVIDWFGEEYSKALATVCKDGGDLDVWEDVLDNPPKVEQHYSGPSSYSSDTLRDGLKKQRKKLGT